jgi:antitoxin ParD1/3/4
MTITLTPAQQEWIAAHVARGDFPSVEEAVRQLIDERIAEHELEQGSDLTWAKPYVKQGLASLERGETVTLEEHRARNAKRLAALTR